MSTEDQAKRVQELIEQIEALPDAAVRELMQECLRGVLQLHGAGLERILQLTAGNTKLREVLINDDVVRGLLLIHGLHPVGLETRLRQALDKVLPYIRSHGGDVELMSLEDGVATLRLQGHCQTCPSSAVTLELAIKAAIGEFCPDLMALEVQGMTTSSPLLPAAADWKDIGNADALRARRMQSIEAAGVPLVVCSANGSLYAYRNACPECGASLEGGTLDDGVLSCASGHRFEVQLAGNGLDNPTIHLDPFPLLVEDGKVKVAV